MFGEVEYMCACVCVCAYISFTQATCELSNTSFKARFWTGSFLVKDFAEQWDLVTFFHSLPTNKVIYSLDALGKITLSTSKI